MITLRDLGSLSVPCIKTVGMPHGSKKNTEQTCIFNTRYGLLDNTWIHAHHYSEAGLQIFDLEWIDYSLLLNKVLGHCL